MPGRATPTLETERLILRQRVPRDVEGVYATMSDPEAMRYWSRAPYESMDDGLADFARESDPWRAWTIVKRADDSVIGFVTAGEKRQGGVMELGYLLARSHWAAGYAREAVSAVIDRLFAEGNRRIFADTDPDNTGSRSLLEALGFTLEGRLRGEWETHIGVRDSVIYGLLRDEWRGAGG